jgi:hypothetical protein
MNNDLPQALESTRNLLAGSLQLHATEQAPSVPGDLLSDLGRRFSSAQAVAAPLQSRSWLAAIQSFIARPAFGMAALAVVILGISVPSLIRSNSTPASGGFRGAVTTPAESRHLSIILIQAPTGVQSSLESSGDFESGVIFSNPSSKTNATGPRILVDFVTSTISALNASDERIYSAPLPADAADLSAAIATAVSRL